MSDIEKLVEELAYFFFTHRNMSMKTSREKAWNFVERVLQTTD